VESLFKTFLKLKKIFQFSERILDLNNIKFVGGVEIKLEIKNIFAWFIYWSWLTFRGLVKIGAYTKGYRPDNKWYQ